MSASSPSSEEDFQSVLKRATASGLGMQPFVSPLERFFSWAQRLIAEGSILLTVFLLHVSSSWTD